MFFGKIKNRRVKFGKGEKRKYWYINNDDPFFPAISYYIDLKPIDKEILERTLNV